MKGKRGQRYGRFCVVDFIKCPICGEIFMNSRFFRKKSKTCSVECMKALQSSLASERLSKTENRSNLGRHKKSYLESSFEKWLIEKGLTFDTEVHYRNSELNKSYYVDFLFKGKNLVIELDGTQHRKTVEKDRVRDEYLTRVHGLTVVRVTHKEYREKSRVDEICRLLGIA